MDYEEMILARQEDGSGYDEYSDCDNLEKCRKGESEGCVYW